MKFTLRKSVAISKRRNSLDSEVDGESGGIKLRDKAKQAAGRQGQYNIKEGIVAFDMKKKKDPSKTNEVAKEKSKKERRRSWADESDVGFSDVRILCPPAMDCDSSASTSSSNGKVTADGPTTLAEEVEGKTKPPTNEDDPEALIQRILKQSHQLHSLLETINSVDGEIEYFETTLHKVRMRKDGQNYVQEAYLPGPRRNGDVVDTAKEGGNVHHLAAGVRGVSLDDRRSGRDAMRVPPTPHETVKNLEDYVALCDRLFSLDDQLRQRQDAILNLSQEIAGQRTQAEPSAKDTKGNPKQRKYERKRVTFSSKLIHNRSSPTKDIGYARAQLEHSAETSVAQRKELDTLHEQIDEVESAFKEKHDRLSALSEEIEKLEKEEPAQEASLEDDEIRACVEMSHSTPVNDRSKNGSVIDSSLDQGIGNDFSPIDVTNRKSPSRSCDTDSSSDTGLSSLHSQDDSEQMVYNISETLV